MRKRPGAPARVIASFLGVRAELVEAVGELVVRGRERLVPREELPPIVARPAPGLGPGAARLGALGFVPEVVEVEAVEVEAVEVEADRR